MNMFGTLQRAQCSAVWWKCAPIYVLNVNAVVILMYAVFPHIHGSCLEKRP
jgi:hypothetical protein